MRRIGLEVVLALGLVLVPLAVKAQPTEKVWRIGVLAIVRIQPLEEAFLKSLRARGYVEGSTLVVQRRFSDGRDERFADSDASLLIPLSIWPIKRLVERV